MNEDEMKKKCFSLINRYIRQELKLMADVRKEWKQEEKEAKGLNLPVNYPRIYSNQYYAFMELQSFWKDLREELKEVKEDE